MKARGPGDNGEGSEAPRLCSCGCGQLAPTTRWRMAGPGKQYPTAYRPRYVSRSHAAAMQHKKHDVDAAPIQVLLRARGVGPKALGAALGVTKQSAWAFLHRARINRRTAERILGWLAGTARTPSLGERRRTAERLVREHRAHEAQLRRLARAN